MKKEKGRSVKKNGIGDLHALARQLGEVKGRARALGIFTDDRELLACPACGLLEDVTIEGVLITYLKDGPQQKDSGLRFREVEGTCFVCPACGTTILVVDEDGQGVGAEPTDAGKTPHTGDTR
jgi:predicted RNA-binding Zn-ribbon protein involved in translation (DUF1610 family)